MKIKHFLRNILVAFIILVLTGCSDEVNTKQVAENQSAIAELTQENEQLREKLETVTEKLETAELKIENLTKDINSLLTEMQSNEQKIVEIESIITDSTEIKFNDTTSVDKTTGTAQGTSENTSKQSPEQQLLGEWHLQYVHEEVHFSWSKSLVFFADGTGMFYQTHYIPKENAPLFEYEYSQGIGLENIDKSVKFTWSLDGEMLQVVFPKNTNEFKYSAAEQKLIYTGDSALYERQKFPELDSYVERSRFHIDMEAKEAERLSKIVGLWYYDVLTWTFNEDKTGIINIPEIGDQPATTREFTFELPFYGDNDPNPIIMIDWGKEGTGIYTIEFRADGAMILTSPSDPVPIKFTRSFDPSNCPITSGIISSATGAITGSMFSKFFP